MNALDQMTKLNMLNTKILSAGTIATPEGIKKAQELKVNVYISAFCKGLPQDYINKFMTEYKSYPGFFTGFGYDSINLISEAVKKQGSSKEDIKKGLLKIKNFPTTIGEVSSDSEGEMVFKTCAEVINDRGLLNLETGTYF